MADPGIQPPYLDPSQYPAYLDVQRKQMLAQALMQSAQGMTQTPQDWNSMRLVPRRSAISTLAPIAAAVLGRKAWDQSQQAQQNYFQGLMGQPSGQQQAPTPEMPPTAAAPTPGLVPPNGIPGSQGLPAPAAARPAAAPTQGPASAPAAGAGNPMLLTGDPRTSQAMLTMMGPAEYAKALAGRYAPTELEKVGRAAGMSDQEIRNLMARSAFKETYIAPRGGERPGTIAFDEFGRPLYAQPDVAHNVQLGVGADGGVSAAPIQGNVTAQTALTGAETGAKEANTPRAIPTQGGGTTYAYPTDVIGTPPSLRGGTSAPTASAAPVAATAPPNSPRMPGLSAPAQSSTSPTAGDQRRPIDLWSGMPKLRIGTGVGAPDAFTQVRLQEAGKKDAALSTQYGQEADLADQKLQYNAEAAKALPKADVGPLSEWLTTNRAKLSELGVPEGLIPGNGTVTPTLELNKFLKNAALQGARQIYGARMTQTEVKLQTDEMSPSPAMTRDAIASLIQQDNIKNAYFKQRAEDYGKYIQSGGDPLRFESWYAKSFPLTKFAQNQAKTQPAAERTVQSASQKSLPTSTAPSTKPWEMNWK